MSSSYLRIINGRYYFRIRVPRDLTNIFKREELQRSLKTRKASTANTRCKLLAASAESVFLQIRTGLLDDSQHHKLIEKHFPSPTPASSLPDKPTFLHQAINAFIEEHNALNKWTAKTALEVANNLEVLKAILGNVHLSSIERNHMVRFVDVLGKIPANWCKTKAYKGLSIQQLTEIDEPAISRSTRNKYIVRASALFKWCMRQGLMKWNPAVGLSIAIETTEGEERKAYIPTDISKILPLLLKYKVDTPERYFVPLIAMFSGMRLNEICQLYVDDIKLVDGFMCFDVNDDGDKRLKNKASRRLIPVHPKLVEIGLLDHVEKMREGEGARLWMNLDKGRDGYSHQFGKWYQKFNRRKVTNDPKKVFHSFRHTVADTLKQAGVAEAVIAEILGHANSSITTGRYGKRYRPDMLMEALMKLDY